ncbi:histidinol dehydrogenase [Alkalihalobacillus pseudalcaliphilus]|uniref:histidinol dehydrogenase n=1 Tax=Alkalihalobacillus pseudalcaliphilus TaxID=79884 RepID=UPI00064DCC47|nr:histidinol dehydrogenase [Alkalihalobacillus pseudalcaliphilus]KMK77467.1 histidinol dehydrogenase [Alkalihalobacillus pseudalcaliphilus]
MKIVLYDKKINIRRDIDTGTEYEQEAVGRIVNQVKTGGDQALLALTKQFDRVTLNCLQVKQEEIEAAYQKVDLGVLEALRAAISNIRDFHQRQEVQSWLTTKPDGTILGQKVTPLDAVGVYVPGGKAVYPSSIVMNVIPAQVAGVEKIVMVSPPNQQGNLDPVVLVTAHEVGVSEIYKVGGAQAIAALAYGTETIPKVDKITGPGNIFVALAKREVFGEVDIDMIAGPSEIVILADEQANPAYIAADLLSQAEHDERASVVLVTSSDQLAKTVAEEVECQLQTLPRKTIAEVSIEQFGQIIKTDNLAESIQVVNELAPEHLEVLTNNPLELLGQIRHAGAIFLGEYSSEPVGDYFAGPNHILPTNGTARFSSPLSVDDFVKKSSIISYSKTALQKNGEQIMALARMEGLEAHARAIEIRMKGRDDNENRND